MSQAFSKENGWAISIVISYGNGIDIKAWFKDILKIVDILV